ncbi:hypothetical protein M405DRAFT_844923 [Rhizopogon salebrosus TDB-379]|nr:hypothetical protein M405DRAFT_844923 [Rhizopogon salebrosus TDB-379]
MSSLAALCASTFAPGLTNNEHQAAAWAVLRHEAHIDGTHYQARTRGGLHPSYIGFNQLMNDDDELEGSLAHKELVKVALQDVFDAITIQDRLDGGISLLIQCAGSEAVPTTSPEEALLDLYITPCELQGMPHGGDTTV